jgi:dTDP-4-dehydrorhamnose reductase
MNEKEYNGYTNYETWLVNLWIDNDEGFSEMVRDMTRSNRSNHELADTIKEFVEENAPETTGLYADLMNAALCEVSWYEIAENHLEELLNEEELSN